MQSVRWLHHRLLPGSQNSLDRNYLYLVEQLGVRVIPGDQVTHVEPAGEGYRRHPWKREAQAPLSARRVILSAGVIGTLQILFAGSLQGGAGCFPGLGRACADHAALDVSRGTTRANEAAGIFAVVSQGDAQNVLPESLGNFSVTAHLLGGAVMAEDSTPGRNRWRSSGVRVFGTVFHG